MAVYNYTARGNGGETLKGKVEAKDERQAVAVLRDRGMVVVGLKPVASALSVGVLEGMSSKVSSNDVVTMTQQLATMLNSGLPLTDSIDLLRVQSKPGLAKVLGMMLHDIQGGSSLGDAMGKHPKVFSTVYVALVRSGEVSGKLDVILERLAQQEEKHREFRSKTKGALVYPVIVVVAMIGVVMVMMVFVVPKMMEMYTSFGAELPGITLLLIGMSNFVSKVWYLIVAAMVGGWVGWQQWRKTEMGRFTTDSWLLKVPVFGKLQAQVALTELAMTLALLIGAGISILEALEIVMESMENSVFKKAIRQAAQGVEKGMPLAAMLARQQVFPPLLPQMVAVGEETGEMDKVLEKLAHYFETTAEQTIKNLTTALEPIIMVMLGVVVGFIVMAVITPLYKLTELF